MESNNVLSSKMTGGPAGLGNPNDRSLRKVEKDVLIPKIVRERSKLEKCSKSKQEFDQCCLDNGSLMVFYCRKQNREFRDCMYTWFNNTDFYEECKNIYLEQRSEFRRTGIKEKREISNKKATTEKPADVRKEA